MLSRHAASGYTRAELIGLYLDQKSYQVYLDTLIELNDERYAGLVHGQRASYKRGCRGPLCKKAMRDYGRVYQRQRFRPEKTRDTYKQRFDALLELIAKAHRERDGEKVAS